MPTSRALTSGWVPAVLVAVAGVLAFHGYAHIPVTPILAMGAWVLWSNTLPGTLIWRALDWRPVGHDGRGRPLLEDLVLGTLTGIVSSLPVYMAGVAVGHARLILGWPVGVVLVFALLPAGRRVLRRRPARPAPTWYPWALAAVMTFLLISLALLWGAYKITPAVRQSPYLDTPYHLSLIAEFRYHFPATTPYVAGTPLKYHWMVYPWMAAATWGTGVNPELMLSELAPTFAIILTVLGVVVVAGRLSGHRSAGIAAGFSLGGLAAFDAFGWTKPAFPFSGGAPWTFLSPTQVFADALAPLLVFWVLGLSRPRRGRWYHWPILLALMVAVGGAKSTMLPLFIAGSLGAAVLVSLLRLKIHWRLVAIAGLSLVAFVLATLIFYGWGSRAVSYGPFQYVDILAGQHGVSSTPMTTGARLLLTLAVLLGMLAPSVGAIGAFLHGRWRYPLGWVLLGGAAAGIGVLMLFHHPSLGQYYFVVSARPLLAILCGIGWARLLAGASRRTVAWCGIAVALGLAVVWTTSSLTFTRKPAKSGTTIAARLLTAYVTPLLLAFAGLAVAGVVCWLVARRRGDRVGVLLVLALITGGSLVYPAGVVRALATGHLAPVQESSTQVIRDDGLTVARWIRRHSTPGQVVATNLHTRLSKNTDGDWRNFWISAYTQRRVLVEGWAYIAPEAVGLPSTEANNASSGAPFWKPHLLEENDDAFAAPTATKLRRLRDKYDVHWLFVDRALPTDIKALIRLTRRHRVMHNYAAFELK